MSNNLIDYQEFMNKQIMVIIYIIANKLFCKMMFIYLDKFIRKPISNVLLGYNEVKSLPNIIGYLQIRHIIFFPVLAGEVMYGCNTIC
jgi:hypothetical protein